MSSSPPPTRAAFCEEFSEEAQKILPETRQTASTANTAAKRSKPDGTRGKPVRDEFSDSGYSSQTAATLGSSGDSSSLESRRGAPPERPEDADPESNAIVEDGKKPSKSRSRSPKKNTLQRTGSKGKGYETSRRRDCECVECLEKKGQRRALPPIDTDNAENTKIRQKDATSPLSPSTDRPRRPYPPPEDVAVNGAPPPARPRASTSQSYKQARPVSFHAGATPHVQYVQHPAFVDRQQMAGYATATLFPQPTYTTPPASYFSPIQPLPPPQNYYTPVATMTSPYEVQPRPRPPMSARPQTMYHDMSSPFMEYSYQPPRSADRPIERQSRRQQPQMASKDYNDRIEARHQMPPPPPPAPRGSSRSRPESRPVIRHATTTTAAYPSQRYVSRDHDEDSSKSRPTSRKHSFEAPPLSRRPSIGRQPRTSDEKVAQALQLERLEREMGRMNIVERHPTSPPSKRRASVYGHESLKDLEGSIEAYQASKSGREYSSIPTGDELVRLMRKKNLPTSNSSDSASRMSGGSRASREGSDNKVGRRPSNDLKKRDSNDEAFAMRIPKGANVNLQPGFDGRSINMELRIAEKGRDGNNGVVGSRPAIREKSRKRYSIIEGQALIETEREPDFDPRNNLSRRESMSRRESVSRRPEEARFVEREIGDDGQRRIIRERIITRTTDRSRRESRNRYGGVDQNMF